jgi:hypothetical protein
MSKNNPCKGAAGRLQRQGGAKLADLSATDRAIAETGRNVVLLLLSFAFKNVYLDNSECRSEAGRFQNSNLDEKTKTGILVAPDT